MRRSIPFQTFIQGRYKISVRRRSYCSSIFSLLGVKHFRSRTRLNNQNLFHMQYRNSIRVLYKIKKPAHKAPTTQLNLQRFSHQKPKLPQRHHSDREPTVIPAPSTCRPSAQTRRFAYSSQKTCGRSCCARRAHRVASA